MGKGHTMSERIRQHQHTMRRDKEDRDRAAQVITDQQNASRERQRQQDEAQREREYQAWLGTPEGIAATERSNLLASMLVQRAQRRDAYLAKFQEMLDRGPIVGVEVHVRKDMTPTRHHKTGHKCYKVVADLDASETRIALGPRWILLDGEDAHNAKGLVVYHDHDISEGTMMVIYSRREFSGMIKPKK